MGCHICGFENADGESRCVECGALLLSSKVPQAALATDSRLASHQTPEAGLAEYMSDSANGEHDESEPAQRLPPPVQRELQPIQESSGPASCGRVIAGPLVVFLMVLYTAISLMIAPNISDKMLWLAGALMLGIPPIFSLVKQQSELAINCLILQSLLFAFTASIFGFSALGFLVAFLVAFVISSIVVFAGTSSE